LLTCPKSLLIIEGVMNKHTTPHEHLFEVGTCMEEVKEFQDRVLDMYDPNDQQKINLLKDLVKLQNELGDLENQFTKYIEENL